MSICSHAAKALFQFGFLALGLGLFLPSVSSAGIISTVQMFGSEAGTGPGLGTLSVPAIVTLNPNNDNQLGGGPNDNNIFVPLKRFNNVGYIDMVFNVLPSGGTTEYKVFESVDNNTFVPWTNYTIQIGFGTGLGFNNIGGNLDDLDFDHPTLDTPPISSVFTTVNAVEDLLIYSTGLHSTGAQSYQFRIDVPDGITSFTLRQLPVAIPEPSLCVLGGLIGLGLYSRRFRKTVR